MSAKMNLITCLLAALVLSWAVPCTAADEGVDKAFEALKTYDWGTPRDQLKAIDDAVVASHKDAAARKALETRLAAVLGTDASRAAKDYVCRKLSLIGTAASVPALAGLLTDQKLSHMARYALERMPCPEAVGAMRDALPKAKGRVKVGVINSLGARRDAKSLNTMVALLKDSDKEIVAAAAAALGSIGNEEAAQALGAFQAKAPKELRLTAADAYLACAERLLADGKKAQARKIYSALDNDQQPKHVQRAAKQGKLAVLRAK
jgi:HEAT repeat protein